MLLPLERYVAEHSVRPALKWRFEMVADYNAW